MPHTVIRRCRNRDCGKNFSARSADVKRGWAKYCCKSCKAKAQFWDGHKGRWPVDSQESRIFDWHKDTHPFSDEALQPDMTGKR